VVFLTGVGVKALFKEAAGLGRGDELSGALKTVTTICRGPKPSAALRQNGIQISISAPEPFTTKELMEAAQREKPGLAHMDYNLGRAEMLLGNDAAAAGHFEHTVSSDTTAEVVEQAWYQLGTIYRRQHRMDEARTAMATFQKLKDEEADKSQERMKKLTSKEDSNASNPEPKVQDPR